MEATRVEANTPASEFIEASSVFLVKDFLPKLRHCLDSMSDEQIWWRPNEQSNSVGNLILHLRGNLKQWMGVGLAGEKFRRDREAEFATRGPVSRQELIDGIEAAVAEADAVIKSFDPAQLLVRRLIQAYQTTPLQAIYHVIEHFSYHLGQILYIYKLQTGTDPGFYRHLSKR